MFKRNFGEKAAWIRSLPCEVTCDRGEGIQAAPTVARGIGGAHGSALDLVPLRWDVHDSYDNDSDVKFQLRWGRTKESVRQVAPWYEARWQQEKEAWIATQHALEF